MKKALCLLLLVVIATVSFAERVTVRLFSNNRIEAIYVSFDLGIYSLYGDSQLLEPELGEGMTVEVKPASTTGVTISVNGYLYGTFETAILRATDTACILCLNPKGVKQRTYEGDLLISAFDKKYTANRVTSSVCKQSYLALGLCET